MSECDSIGGLECNPSSSMNHESNANMKNEADTSSLKLPDEWLLLLPAARTKAPLSHSSETQPSCPDMQGYHLKSRGLQVQQTGGFRRYVCAN